MFRARMHYVGVPNSRKKFRYEGTQSTPLDPKWRLGVFGSISQTFSTKNYAKFVFRARMHYFRVPNSRKKFCYEGTQCTPFGLKWCLGVFWSISQTFGMKNYVKLVFRARMHYFGAPNSRKKFHYEGTQSTPLDPKWCLGVFRSISQTFDTKIHTKVVFRGWKHYFGVPNFLKKFFHEHIQSLLDPKRCLVVFQSILQTFGTKKYVKHVFRVWMHYFGV